jgi:hypothetical protein
MLEQTSLRVQPQQEAASIKILCIICYKKAVEPIGVRARHNVQAEVRGFIFFAE